MCFQHFSFLKILGIMVQKLTHKLAGDLGETLALAKFISLGLQAYLSPPGAPGHDIIVVTPEGPKSVEVKTRQFINSASEISRWPVDILTKANADYFLFIELNLSTLSPTFYLLNNVQALDLHIDYSGNGNCPPSKVRSTVGANDFSALTGEPVAREHEVPRQPVRTASTVERARTDLRKAIATEARFKNSRIVQYRSDSIDVFVDGALQGNAIENLRRIAKAVGVSEYNNSGGPLNTRQLGKMVIEAIKERGKDEMP
jgi:hypothetical protein